MESRLVRSLPSPTRRAFSFVDIMVVMGVFAIFAAIAIPMILNVVPSSQASLAKTNMNRLNQAILKYNQANQEMAVSARSSATDEAAVIAALQDRATTGPAPGSPYLSPTLAVPTTGVTTTYRAIWNGRLFQLASPGETGDGVNLLEIQE